MGVGWGYRDREGVPTEEDDVERGDGRREIEIECEIERVWVRISACNPLFSNILFTY